LTKGFLSAGDVGKQLKVGQDHVRHLIRKGRLKAKKMPGTRGDHLIHPVDAARLLTLREVSVGPQEPLKPDMFWVIEACRFLMDKVRTKLKFKPKQVVGIAFGGLVPASLISSTYQLPLRVIQASHYEGESKLATVTVRSNLRVLEDRPTLIVDDIADTGETFEAVRDRVLEYGVKGDNLLFATLHKRAASKFLPDCYVDVVDGWVRYPWEQDD